MRVAGRIDERGWTRVLAAPATDPDDVGGQLDLVARALAALEPACVPLALEVERAFISQETGFPCEPPPEPPVLLFTEDPWPGHRKHPARGSGTTASAPGSAAPAAGPSRGSENLWQLMRRTAERGD